MLQLDCEAVILGVSDAVKSSDIMPSISTSIRIRWMCPLYDALLELVLVSAMEDAETDGILPDISRYSPDLPGTKSGAAHPVGKLFP